MAQTPWMQWFKDGRTLVCFDSSWNLQTSTNILIWIKLVYKRGSAASIWRKQLRHILKCPVAKAITVYSNVIPDYTLVLLHVRTTKATDIKRMMEKVENCFKAAAVATRCTVFFANGETWAPFKVCLWKKKGCEGKQGKDIECLFSLYMIDNLA